MELFIAILGIPIIGFIVFGCLCDESSHADYHPDPEFEE